MGPHLRKVPLNRGINAASMKLNSSIDESSLLIELLCCLLLVLFLYA